MVDEAPKKLAMVRYWDTAYQKNRTSDYTAGILYGVASDGLSYILHVARIKATPYEVERFIVRTASQDDRNIRVVLQQEPGSGSALWIDSMRRGPLHGYPVYQDQVKGSKFERSQPFRAAAEAGNIKLVRGAWNDDFLEECEQFSPDEREYAHDDQVDAACGAFNYLKKPEPFEYVSIPRRLGSLLSPRKPSESLSEPISSKNGSKVIWQLDNIDDPDESYERPDPGD